MAVALRVIKGGKRAEEEVYLESVMGFEELSKKGMTAYGLAQDLEADYAIPSRRLKDIRWRQLELLTSQVATIAADCAAEVRRLRSIGGDVA